MKGYRIDDACVGNEVSIVEVDIDYLSRGDKEEVVRDGFYFEDDGPYVIVDFDKFEKFPTTHKSMTMIRDYKLKNLLSTLE